MAVVLTIAAVVLPVGPAIAGPTQDQPRTWGVRPSPATAGASGPAERSAFAPTVAPGASATDAVEITNFSAAPLTLEVYATDAFNTSGGGFDVLPAAEQPTGVGAWVTLDRSTVTLAPGATQDIPFTIAVPADAEPGDHAGGIVASITTGATDSAGNPVRLDQRVGARIYLRVDGPLRPELAVEDVRVRYHGSANPLAMGRATVTYTVRNTGNVRLATAPTIDLEGILGAGHQSVRGEPVPELLPGSSVTASTVVDDAWPAIRLRADVTIRATVPGGTKADPVTASGSTWAIPWTLVAIFGTLLVLALIARWQVRRQQRASSPTETAAEPPSTCAPDATSCPERSTD